MKKGIFAIVVIITVVFGIYKAIDAIQTASDLAYIREREAREAQIAREAEIAERARLEEQVRFENEQSRITATDLSDSHSSCDDAAPRPAPSDTAPSANDDDSTRPDPPVEAPQKDESEAPLFEHDDLPVTLYGAHGRTETTNNVISRDSNFNIGVELMSDHIIDSEKTKYSYAIISYPNQVEAGKEFEVVVQLTSDTDRYTGSITLQAEEDLYLTAGSHYASNKEYGSFHSPAPLVWEFRDDYNNAKACITFPLYAAPDENYLNKETMQGVTGSGFHVGVTYKTTE